MAKFYLAIVQAVLLYGADSWVITKDDWRRLRNFHHRAVRFMTNSHIQKQDDDTWVYPDHEELRNKCDLEPIEVYIERRRGTLRKYLETECRDLLTSVRECRPPALHSRKLLWWKQPWRIGTLFQEDRDTG